ncbi:uncharacterized protein LOC120414591 [Culex pipiens pallens]|uniref:uncharacterized protein LOC120414591 n=1 Tax=Culex pipiens pallens TaxID=42434 RepID=UPI0019537B2F|nr:uncharacterized protein LOC120414591 [Culex pipiens pallens]
MASNCFSYIPSVEEYFAAYSTALIVLLAVLAVFLVLVTVLYVQIVKHLVRRYEPRCQKALIFSNGIYLVIVVLCIVAVASEKMELVSVILFSWSVLALYMYIVMVAGGHDNVGNYYESNNSSLGQGGRIRRILFRLFGKYKRVRIYIIQFPIVTTILNIIQIVYYFTDVDRYYRTVYAFLPFSLTSILLYLISFTLLVNFLGPSFPDQQIKKKFQFLRLAVLVIKIQTTILEAIFRQLHFECDTFAGEAWSLYNLIKQPLIVVQISLLALATWNIYRKEAKDSDGV